MTSKGQDLDNGVKEHSLQSVSVDTVDVQKSQTTTWDAKNPGNNEINFLSTGAGFLPSTVAFHPFQTVYY